MDEPIARKLTWWCRTHERLTNRDWDCDAAIADEDGWKDSCDIVDALIVVLPLPERMQ